MDSNKVFSELNSLERKFELLLLEHSQLKDQIAQLNNENSSLKSVIASKEQAIHHFHNNAKISKLVDEIGADESATAEMKKSIDEYIREIDKCIAHLSK